MMQLSPETLAILANYSQINPNIVLTPGNTLRTIHTSKAVFSTAEIKEVIDGDAAILDLPRFLRTVNLLENPSISFGAKQFTLTDGKGKTKINYSYADSTPMLKVPLGTKEFPSKAKINLTADTLKAIATAGKSLRLPHMRLQGSTDGVCIVQLHDVKGVNKDTYTIDLAADVQEITEDFIATLNTDYINFVSRDYLVDVNAYAVAFKSNDIQYMVAYAASNTK